MNEKIVRKPGSVLIDPKILCEARIEALRSEKKLWEWLEEAIKEKRKKVKSKRPVTVGLFGYEK